MNSTWYVTHSSAEPAELDTTSSPTTVYMRRNIHTISVTDGMNDEPTIMWEYEEKMIPREDYNQLFSAATQSIMQALSDLEISIAELGG